jgi:hypothetical protein
LLLLMKAAPRRNSPVIIRPAFLRRILFKGLKFIYLIDFTLYIQVVSGSLVHSLARLGVTSK